MRFCVVKQKRPIFETAQQCFCFNSWSVNSESGTAWEKWSMTRNSKLFTKQTISSSLNIQLSACLSVPSGVLAFPWSFDLTCTNFSRWALQGFRFFKLLSICKFLSVGLHIFPTKYCCIVTLEEIGQLSRQFIFGSKTWELWMKEMHSQLNAVSSASFFENISLPSIQLPHGYSTNSHNDQLPLAL